MRFGKIMNHEIMNLILVGLNPLSIWVAVIRAEEVKQEAYFEINACQFKLCMKENA